MDPSSPEVQVLLTMHFIAQSAPDIRREIQKATAGLQTPVIVLFQLAYLVLSNRDMAKKTEHTQRNMKKAHMIAVALSTQRPLKGKPAFLDQSGPGRPQGPWVPIQGQDTLCGQKGTGGRTEIDVPFAYSQALGEGAPQTPEGDGGPSAIDGFAIRRLKGPKAESGSA